MSRLISATAVVLALVAGGCNPAEDEAETTISPATPPPVTTPTDTDAALTQTTEVGEDRSPNEGGVLTDTAYGGTPTTTSTSPVPTDSNAPGSPPTP